MVTVIVPAYNSERHISKCINSILEQSFKELEIIIVNDGSTDNTYNICTEFARQDQRIKVINKNNEGVSVARNIGISLANGEYISFVDSDDYIEYNMIEELVNTYHDFKECELVVCGYNDISISKNDETKLLNNNQLFEALSKIESVRGYLWNKMFKTDIIKKNKIFFEDNIYICEDLLFCYKYVEVIKKGVVNSKCLYHYENNEQSVMNSSFNKKELSLFNAYHKIINILERYDNRELIELLKCNYVKHCIQIGKKLILSNEAEKQYIIKLLQSNAKKYKRSFFKSREVNLKYKIGYIVLILFPRLLKIS